MNVYLVGGAVRDGLLGRPLKERDWLVTGATPQQMLDLGYRQIDAAFPVFLHPQTGEEYALARREIKRGKGYKGFEIETSVTITIEEDLKRRDLTINAMALDEHGQLIDPYGGQADLHGRKLRHVSDAFVEDPFRLIRIARFAAQLGQYDFHVSHTTFKLMKAMVQPDELQQISLERFMQEMDKALASDMPWVFFKLLGKCGALDFLIKDANRFINGEQMQHGQDSVCLQKLKKLCQQSQDIDLRFTAVFGYILLLDGYDVSAILPLNKVRQQTLLNLRKYADVLLHSLDAEALLQAMESCGVIKHTEQFKAMLLLLSIFYDEAQGRLAKLLSLPQSFGQIKSQKFVQQGLNGKALGEALRQQRLERTQQVLTAVSE